MPGRGVIRETKGRKRWEPHSVELVIVGDPERVEAQVIGALREAAERVAEGER